MSSVALMEWVLLAVAGAYCFGGVYVLDYLERRLLNA